ncbi:MAG: FmdB family zinc ribbon protein [Myxococcaceae bacterium]
MPLFEYRCAGCGERFELLVRGGAKVECPKCHGRKLEKQFSVFAVNAHGATREAATPCGHACDNPAGPGGCHRG